MAQRFGKGLAKKAIEKPELSKQKLTTEKRAISPEKQAQLNEMLIKAAKEGKTKRAERLLKAGADIEARDNNDHTALMLAADQGYTETCKFLLEHNANIEARDNDGWSALTWASVAGRTETANFLKSMKLLQKLMGKENLGPFMSSFRECTQQ